MGEREAWNLQNDQILNKTSRIILEQAFQRILKIKENIIFPIGISEIDKSYGSRWNIPQNILEG